jgi:hypothetical protein
MKLLIHLLVFAVGCGMGIWWGANHPIQAADIAQREQDKASQIRMQVLEQLQNESPKAQQMYQDEKKKLTGN